jgi:putative NIF3 family GTP cyclohydrolase 1 type 2
MLEKKRSGRTMDRERVSLNEVVRELDKLFSIHDWGADPAMSRFVPQVYQGICYDHTKVFEIDFCERYNGLMLRSGDAVKEVYCAAFPTPEVLEKLLVITSGEALLFTHHPIDMEVSGVGFLPISPDTLGRLRAKGVSVYACHAPMDCHDEIGTNASIVRAFDVQVKRSFAKYGNGYAGRIGSIACVNLDELVRRGKKVFGVDRVEIGGARPCSITNVAIVAGGGDDLEVLEEAEQMGAQVFITGEWYTRTTPRDEQGREWAARNKATCKAYAESSKMALLGFSHAATEYLVMRTQMAGYFRRKGIEVVCLEQSDWWR